MRTKNIVIFWPTWSTQCLSPKNMIKSRSFFRFYPLFMISVMPAKRESKACSISSCLSNLTFKKRKFSKLYSTFIMMCKKKKIKKILKKCSNSTFRKTSNLQKIKKTSRKISPTSGSIFRSLHMNRRNKTIFTSGFSQKW